MRQKPSGLPPLPVANLLSLDSTKLLSHSKPLWHQTMKSWLANDGIPWMGLWKRDFVILGCISFPVFFPAFTLPGSTGVSEVPQHRPERFPGLLLQASFLLDEILLQSNSLLKKWSKKNWVPETLCYSLFWIVSLKEVHPGRLTWNL